MLSSCAFLCIKANVAWPWNLLTQIQMRRYKYTNTQEQIQNISAVHVLLECNTFACVIIPCRSGNLTISHQFKYLQNIFGFTVLSDNENVYIVQKWFFSINKKIKKQEISSSIIFIGYIIVLLFPKRKFRMRLGFGRNRWLA